jgi:hypothetical protein
MKRDIVLITLRIKGTCAADVIRDAVGSECADVIAGLVEQGLIEPTKRGFKLTEAGRQSADEVFAAERKVLGPESVDELYDSFCTINVEVKQVITDWQLKSSEPPVVNDHADKAYDEGVLARLDGTRRKFSELLDGSGDTGKRFAQYSLRLARAMAEIQSGDPSFVASPARDSFHTAWFELHEDLIHLAGRRRSDEATAGRA